MKQVGTTTAEVLAGRWATDPRWKGINNALLRADQFATAEGRQDTTDRLAPIVADAEAGFGGPINAFELTKAMIAAGAAGIHYEDQQASEKKDLKPSRPGACGSTPTAA